MVTQDPLFLHNFLPLISLPFQWTLSAHGDDEMLWLKFEPSDQAVYSLLAGSRGRDGLACEGSEGTGGGI